MFHKNSKSKAIYINNKNALKRMTSLIIVAIMMFFNVSEALAAATNDGGFTLNLSWSGSNSADYVWDTANSERKTVRMQVNYSNKAPERGYVPGELVITVPGIGGANRGSVMEANDVAADKAGSPVISKNWSYTYNSKNDVYTFVNNVEVKSKNSFVGSFELLWTLNSRTSVDGFNKNIQAKLKTVDNKTVNSNSINYTQKRIADIYSITQSPTALYSANGINGSLAVGDYYWVGFPVNGRRQSKSLPIKDSYYKVVVPEGAIVTSVLNSRTLANLPVTKEGNSYIIKQNAGVNELSYPNGSEWTYIYVAYPKDKYDASSVVTSGLELWGSYEDTDGTSVKLAETESELRMGDYDFMHHLGGLYTVSARSYAPRVKFDFHTGMQTTQENTECYNDGFLNATDLTNGKGVAQFALGSSLYAGSKETPYSMEFSSDFIDVLLNSGNYRQLKTHEYEYVSVAVPSTNQFRNLNNIPVESGAYGVDIYAVTLAEPEVKKLVKSTFILSNSQSIALPEGTYRVFVKLKSLAENVNFENLQTFVQPIRISAKFHIDNDASLQLNNRVKTDQGRVVNNSYFKIFDKDDNWVNNNYTADQYDDSTNLDIAQRDIDTYGTYLERVKDVLHVHEITSLYYSNVALSSQGRDSYGFNTLTTLTTYFKYGGDGALENFSMSTVLPDGLSMPYNQIDINDFIASLSISGLSITSAEAKSRITAVVQDDYKGSGRVYVNLDFDLAGLNITNPTAISANFPTFISNENFTRVGANYNIQSVSMIGDTHYLSRAQYNGAIDNGGYDEKPELWSDINNNKISTDSLSYSRNYLSIEAAVETFLDANKSVSTEYTNGQFFSGSNKDVPDVGYDGNYTYKLKLNTEKNSKASDIVFIDNLENETNSVWQGTFAGVDTKYAEKMGFKTTVYYSNSRTQPKDLNSEGWSTELPADLASVKSVAVKLTAGELKENSFLYVLINMTAPAMNVNLKNTLTENAYDVDFTVTDTIVGVGGKQSLASNQCRVQLIEPYGRVSLIKKDNADVLLSNVKFDLIDESGKTIKTGLTTNDAGQISVDKIPYGNYFFKETYAPDGYVLNQTEIPVTVNSRTVIVNAVNQRKPGQITLVKKNSENLQLYVKGAVFSLYNSNGTLIKSGMTTNAEGKLDSTMYPILGNLEWGNYYFQETSAPVGYVLNSTPIEFKIDAASAEKGETNILNAKNSQDGGANAQFIKYEILEDGVTKTTTPVSDAVYQLFFFNNGWKSMGTYMTDTNGEIYISGLVYGDYYLKEKSAPQGYYINTDEVHFSVDGTHIGDNFQTVTSHDIRKYGNVNMYKLGDSKEEVQGAVFGLYDTDGKLLREETTSVEGVIDFNNLAWGNYYLQEISAPAGYQLNTEKYFVTVERANVDAVIIQNIINNQVKGKVRLTKMAEANPAIKLAGAEYGLFKNDGSLIGNYTSDANGEILVTELVWGSYYFEETKAPTGYGLSSEKIRFTVNAVSSNSVQELEAFDPALSAQITLTKKVKVDSLVFAHGDPTFTFKVAGTDINGTARTYYKTITFTEEYLASHQPSVDGYVSASVVFTQMIGGTYTASEEPVVRYRQVAIEEVENGEVKAENVEFKLVDGNSLGKATFVNDKQVQSGTSHTSLVTNIIKKAKVLTGISANYRGTNTISTSTLNRSLLDVYAIYDDGTQKKLADTDYTLDPENFEGLTPGVYTVTASYSDSGRVKKSSFQVTVDPPIPFTWKVDTTTNEATITAYKGNSSVVRFPQQVKENGVVYPVTSLMKQATANATSPMPGLTNATGIIIPEGIVDIGHGTFYNLAKLKGDLELPKSVKTIGNYSFYKTGYTGKLKLPDGLETIGSNSFYFVLFSGDLNIPDTVTDIGAFAFRQKSAGSDAFKNGTLHLSNNLVNIGNEAFCNATSFTGDLHIPNSVETIGVSAFEFSGFTSVSNISNNPRLVSISTKAFASMKNVAGNLVVPDNIKVVGVNAFSNSTYDGNLTLPKTLEKIDDSAFASCKFTGELSIPDSVNVIGNYAFDTCGTFTGGLSIPDTVKVIGKYAFRRNIGFVSLKLPMELETIGAYAFQGCIGIKGEISIPDNVTTIEDYAFHNCTGITGALLIPNKVSTIGVSAFQNCFGIVDDLYIPESVTSLGNSAFENTQIVSVSNFPSSLTVVPTSVFSGCNKIISMPMLGANITKIGANAFYNCSSIVGDVVIPNNVVEIQNYAFSGCGNINSLTLPNGIQVIGNRAFQNCYKLNMKLVLPDTLYSIGDGAFFNCTKLTGISFPNNPNFTTITRQCFYSSAIGDIVIPDSVTTIGEEAFIYNSSMMSLVLSKNLTSIGKKAFASSYGIKGKIVVPDTLEPTAIGENAFDKLGYSTATFTVELPEKCRDYESSYVTDKRATFTYY